MAWSNRLRGRRGAPTPGDPARGVAGVGRAAPAGRGGLPALIAGVFSRRGRAPEGGEDPFEPPPADEATVEALRAELADELARAAERSQGEAAGEEPRG